jgi:nitrate reductase gamma subunit
MRDQIVFGVAPWIAAFSFLMTAAVRYVQSRGGEPTETATGRMDATDGLSAWSRYSIALVCLGHVVAVAFPTALLLWNRDPLRLIALEAVGLIAAAVALVALIAAAIQRKWWTDLRYVQSPSDVVAATLILLEVISGIAIAVRYRWASSWSAVTLTPYLRTLVGFTPSTVLVAHMPFLVKLHLFSGFALFGVLPLTRLARSLALTLRDLVQVTVAPVTSVWRPAWYSREVGTRQIRDGEM